MSQTPAAVIRDTNQAYLELIARLFADEIRDFEDSESSVSTFIERWLAGSKVDEVNERRPDVTKAVTRFWDEHRLELSNALFDLNGLKCTVGSDIFPFHVQQKLMSVGCYADTFVVEDYVRRLGVSDPSFSNRHASFGLVAFALEIHRLKELLTADLPIPPLVLLDQGTLNEQGFRKMLVKMTAREMKKTVEHLFGKTFLSFADIDPFLAKLVTVEQVENALTTTDYSITDRNEGTFCEQLEYCIKDTSQRIKGFADNAGRALWSLLLQNVGTANDHFIRSQLMDGTPLIHGDIEWEYVLRRMDKDQKLDLSATRGLQKGSAQTSFALRHVTESQLLQLRQEGALAGLRERLRNAVRNIEVSSASDIQNVTAEMNREITSMMIEHQNNLQRLSSEGKKFCGLELAPLLGAMGLIIAGAACDNSALEAIGGIAGISGAASITDVGKSAHGHLKERSEAKNCAAAILCKSLTG